MPGNVVWDEGEGERGIFTTLAKEPRNTGVSAWTRQKRSSWAADYSRWDLTDQLGLRWEAGWNLSWREAEAGVSGRGSRTADRQKSHGGPRGLSCRESPAALQELFVVGGGLSGCL